MTHKILSYLDTKQSNILQTFGVKMAYYINRSADYELCLNNDGYKFRSIKYQIELNSLIKTKSYKEMTDSDSISVYIPKAI